MGSDAIETAASTPSPTWLHPGHVRPGGYEIESAWLALHFARKPTPEMEANARANH